MVQKKAFFSFQEKKHGIYKKSRYSLSSRVMGSSVLKVFFLVIKKKVKNFEYRTVQSSGEIISNPRLRSNGSSPVAAASAMLLWEEFWSTDSQTSSLLIESRYLSTFTS